MTSTLSCKGTQLNLDGQGIGGRVRYLTLGQVPLGSTQEMPYRTVPQSFKVRYLKLKKFKTPYLTFYLRYLRYFTIGTYLTYLLPELDELVFIFHPPPPSVCVRLHIHTRTPVFFDLQRKSQDGPAVQGFPLHLTYTQLGSLPGHLQTSSNGGRFAPPLVDLYASY